MRYIFVALSVMVFCNQAFAIEFKKEIAKCASIEGELSRLNCFDKIADSYGISKKKTTGHKKAGKWLIETKKNPLDDSKTIFAALTSQSGSSKWGRPVTLILRCESKKTEAFINWGSYLGEDRPNVLTRIGDAEAIPETWNSSTDMMATFYEGDAILFIKKLESGKKFVAQISPYMESPITAIFDLTGIEKVTKSIRETCEWEKTETTTADNDEDSSKNGR